jgi:hypothetical protein
MVFGYFPKSVACIIGTFDGRHDSTSPGRPTTNTRRRALSFDLAATGPTLRSTA